MSPIASRQSQLDFRPNRDRDPNKREHARQILSQVENHLKMGFRSSGHRTSRAGWTIAPLANQGASSSGSRTNSIYSDGEKEIIHAPDGTTRLSEEITEAVRADG